MELTRSRQRVDQLELQLARQRKVNSRQRRALRQRRDAEQSVTAAAAAQVSILTSQVTSPTTDVTRAKYSFLNIP